MILFAFLALFLGILGLWFVVQKRIQLTQKQLEQTFKSLSFDLMEKNSRSFLDLATASLEKQREGARTDLEARHLAIEATLKPLREAMQQFDHHQRELEKQVAGMVAAEKELRKETIHLVQALRSPQIRGSWGQLHLRRVVELAGLLNNCDFFEQKALEGEGRIWRPDLVIHLPGKRHIVVDAKTPLEAYLDASDAGDEEKRQKKLLEHAAHVRKHMKDLSGKEYWKQLDSTPEYVILFLPAEAFFSAALQVDPTLIEIGADQNIIVATPTTLIAILRAVAYSWKQEGLSKRSSEIAKLGQELYERIGILCESWGRVGKALNGATDAYNQSLSSLKSRLLVTARKLKESGNLAKDLLEPTELECNARGPIDEE